MDTPKELMSEVREGAVERTKGGERPEPLRPAARCDTSGYGGCEDQDGGYRAWI
jgi:hypothetical protein